MIQKNKDQEDTTMTTTGACTVTNVIEYRLRFSRPLSRGEATHLRGFFGHTFANELLLHHHHPDGRLHYDYPRVQFKVIDREAYLIGVNEGCDLVTRLWSQVDQATIAGQTLPIMEAHLSRRREKLGESDTSQAYRFHTAWLALNQENHHQYLSLADASERRALLERVLVGNCLSLAKGLGHRVIGRLAADATGLRPWRTRFKGVNMVGFIGTFRMNFHLPNRIGIGKSVSRGFGTVERIDHATNEVHSC